MRQTGTILANLLCVGIDLIDKIALVTDGRASGTCGGLLVLHLAPEAAVGGPIAAVHDGDIIDIDVVKHCRISVQLAEDEISNRLVDWQPPPRTKRSSFPSTRSW